MVNIRRSSGNQPIFALSGRIDREHLSQLRAALEAERDVDRVTLDLDEVRLVDRESVRFLASCEARGIQLKNCPLYVREWIETGRVRTYELRCEALPGRND
jgi:ABC-type transporter Mla MlaB component